MDNQFLNFGKPPISMGGLFFITDCSESINKKNSYLYSSL